MSENTKILDKIKAILFGETPESTTVSTETEEVKEIKLASATLEDGGTIIYWSDDFGVDTLVFSDEALTEPFADGEYVLDSGVKFIVAGGVVTEITEPEATEDTPEEESLEKDEMAELKKLVDTLQEKMKNFSAMEKEIVKFKATEKKLADEIEKLSGEPEAESVTTIPSEVIEKTKTEKRLDTLDMLRRLKK